MRRCKFLGGGGSIAIAWTRGSWLRSVVLAALLLPSPACSDAVTDFYRGRQINLVVGFGTGGGYDVYARLLARHLGRHIPGNPSIIVQNMPGAASLRAVNYLY